ncbi:MAG: hypothetical protein U5K81_13040 [Trueperaceae bacterium]|nr:hypothetical protein [Trueperaceae bacterium]
MQPRCVRLSWFSAVSVRFLFLVLVSGLPQLAVALEDGTGKVEQQEIRAVWRVLFFDRGPTPAGPSIVATPVALQAGAVAGHASAFQRWERDRACSARRVVDGTTEPGALGPSKRVMTELRTRARHDSNYV